MKRQNYYLAYLAVSAMLFSATAETFSIGGAEAHPVTQFGRISYPQREGMTGEEWKTIPRSSYTLMGEGNIANLNGSSTDWQKANLAFSQLRFDGWFQVLSDKAGEWHLTQKFDDYFAFFIDEKEVISNNTYKNEASATVEIAEGWHQFSIIAGDTYGGYGSNKDFGGDIGRVPFVITVNEKTYAFNDTNFPQGRDKTTLTEDTDWTAYENVILSTGAVLDLAGHKLKVRKITCPDRASIIGGEGSEIEFAVEDVEYDTLGDATYLEGASNLLLSESVKILFVKNGIATATSTLFTLGDKADYPIEFVQNDGAVNLLDKIHSIGGGASGNTGHGIYRMNGGTLSTGSSSEFRIGSYGCGEFIQTAGEITIGNWLSIAREANSTGIYTMTGGKLKMPNKQLWIGCENGSKGVWNIGGDAEASFRYLCLGGDLGGNRTKHAEMNISGNAKITVDSHFRAAQNQDCTGPTYFKVTQSGGELTIKGDMNLPSHIGSGSFIQTGGKTTVANATVYIGCGNSKNVNKPSVGTFDIGGEFTAGGNGVSLGRHTGGSGTLILRKGGVLTTPSIYRNVNESDTYGAAIFNGGTVRVAKDGKILNDLNDVKFGADEVVFDTGSYTTSFNNSPVSRVSPFGIIAKEGEGTLTVGSIQNVGKLSVRKGTLALASGTDITPPFMPAHRWSFSGDLTDSVTGEKGVVVGSGETYADGTVKLPGGTKGTCYIDLGANKLPGDNVTIEMWLTIREIRNWTRGFVLCTKDLGNIIAFNTRRSNNGNICNFQCCGTSQYTDKVLEKDKQYYVAFVFEADGNGGTVVGQYLKEVGKSGFLWTNTFTQADWTFSKNAGQDNFWLGHSDGNDYDIKADYDEMRIWSSALTPEEIEKSGVAAPDTTFGETEIEIKSDATLDLGGNTLTVSSLSGYGKVQNGKLVVTKSICVKAGSVLTVGSGATIDITNANIVFSDSANIPTEGFTIAASSDGGRIVSSEPRRISGGYWLKLTDEKASIMRKGLIITFK